MTAFQFGPFLIKMDWIFMVIAGVSSYVIMKKTAEQSPAFQRSFLDAIVNMIFIIFIVYKFSIILFRPVILFRNPMEILYFTGGTKGLLLGIVLAVIYLAWKTKKGKWPLPFVFQTSVYGIVTFITVFWLLRTLFYLVY